MFCCCCSVSQSCPTLCDPVDCSMPVHLSFHISRRFPKFMSIASVMPSSHPILWHPLLLLSSVFPTIKDFSNESAVHIRWPKYWTFSSASVLPKEDSGLIPLDWLVWFPCCPRDSQESSTAPQFKGINSLVLHLLYAPALTTVHAHWEDHSLDYMDLFQQSNVSDFQHTV